MTTAPPRTGNSRIDYTASGKALQQQQAPAALDLVKRHKAFLDARMAQIEKWVTHGLRPEALVRFILRDMDGPKGEKLRACTQESIYLGLLACAVTGLEPGALKGEAYLVPYWNKAVSSYEATFQRGYRGVIKQARRSREVVALWANVVYENDVFDLDLGSANRLVHKPPMRERGEQIVGAYAIARLVNGQDEIEWMDRLDLDHVHEAGSDTPAWKDWPDQMMRKAPIHRLGKRLPLGADYYTATVLDRATTAAEQRRIIDIEANGEGSRTEVSAAVAAEMAAQATSDIPPDEAAEIERMERESARGGGK